MTTPGPHPGTAAAPRGTWTITTTGGATVTGHLPAWSVTDPSRSGVPLDRLSACLAEVNHHAPFDGVPLTLTGPDDGTGPAREEDFFRGGIDCDPYAPDPDPAVPVVNLEVLPEHWIHGLDPDGLARLAATLRTLADRLDGDLRARLTEARADWAAAHPR